jgi:beta-lactamase regulating signal transducer with metallopeptidase domain
MFEFPAFDSAACRHLAMALAHFLWEGVVIGVLAALIAATLRGRPSPVRYGVYLAAMLLMAACLPTTFAVVAATSPSIGDGSLAAGAGLHSTKDVDGGSRSAGSTIASTGHDSDPIAETSAAAVSQEATNAASASARSAASGLLAAVSPYVAAAYLLGMAVMLLRMAVSLYGGHRLRRDAVAVDGHDLLTAIRRAAERVGLRRAPVVAFCKRVPGPMVIGMLRPVVLLPVMLTTGLTPQQLQTILTHEFAHLRRYDHWALMLQRLVEALLFFHPAVWYVSRCLSVEREHCCDDAVISAGAPRMAYAELLLQLAEQRVFGKPSPTALAAAGDQPSRLRRRIARLLIPSAEPAVRLGRAWTVGVLVLSAAIAVPPALSYVFAQPPGGNAAANQPASRSGGPAKAKKPGDRRRANSTPRQMAAITQKKPIRIVWGKPYNGLAVGIGEVRTSLKSPMRPIIDAYLENRGTAEIQGGVILGRSRFVLELDKQFYVEADFGGPIGGLPPGKRVGPIVIGTDYFNKVKRLAPDNVVDQTTPGPDLTAGKHSLRLHYKLVGLKSRKEPVASGIVNITVKLSPYPTDDAVKMIVKELKNSDPDVRRTAALAAGKLRLAGCRDALVRALEDKDATIRRYASESLGKIGDRAATKPLRKLLKDREMAVRLAAAESLVELGVPLEPSWVEPIIKSKDYVFQNAIWLVRRHAGKQAVPTLIRCLDVNDPSINNYYNYTLVWQIHACGGPDLKYHHDFEKQGTKQQVEANRRVLSKLRALLDKKR